MRLLIFNPETEYALASGASFYTPPARVEAFRRERQLLPELWAAPDDFILVDEAKTLQSRFRLAEWADLGMLFEKYPDLTVEPWGWNPALIRRLIDSGVPADRLPDGDSMARIRSLAHRRTTVILNSLWIQSTTGSPSIHSLHGSIGRRPKGLILSLPEAGRHIPSELTSIEECMAYYRANPGCWMKAPWSSSGRGVINTSADMTPVLVEQWCRGILRRQGSVMGETGADRIADFATEWRIDHNGEAIFIGLSSFSTSNRGKYISNQSLPQNEMRSKFDSLSELPIERVIPVQKCILEEVLSGYVGPCGVDMIIEADGNLRPFVELNLRMTMGMLNIGVY